MTEKTVTNEPLLGRSINIQSGDINLTITRLEY